MCATAHLWMSEDDYVELIPASTVMYAPEVKLKSCVESMYLNSWKAWIFDVKQREEMKAAGGIKVTSKLV